MSAFNNLKVSFSAGMLSNKLKGRVDAELYNDSAELIKNFFILPQGGLIKRPGSRLVVQDVDSSVSDISEPFMIPFIFDEDNAYIVTFHTSFAGGEIVIYNRSGTKETIRTAISGSIFSYGAGGTLVQQPDPKGFRYAISGNTMVITHKTGDIVPVVIARVVEDGVVSFVIERFTEGTFALTSGIIPVGDLDTSTSSGLIKQVLRVPYETPNANANILFVPAAISGSLIDLTVQNLATAAVPFFTTRAGSGIHWVGTYIKINQGTNTGIARIQQWVSTSHVRIRILINFSAAAATDNWQLSSWGHEYGWPKEVSFYEGRLIFGATDHKPNGLWGSLVGNFYQFMETKLLQDSSTDVSGLNYFGDSSPIDPFNFNIEMQLSNNIRWMVAQKQLHVGSIGGETTVEGTDEQLISSTSINVKNRTSIGGSTVQPVLVNKSTIYISRDGKNVYEFVVDPKTLEYISVNLSKLNPEILEWNAYNDTTKDAAVINTIKVQQVAWQASRRLLWFVTENTNALVCLSFDKEANLIAWQVMDFGGHAVDGSLNEIPAKVHSVITLPNADGTFDDVYVTVERYINGATDYYIEKIGPDFKHPSLYATQGDINDWPIFVDSAITRDYGSPNANVTAINHLEGEVVRVLGDGEDMGTYTVSSGQITLSSAKSHIVVGLAYEAKARTFRLEAGGDKGSSQGQIKRVSEARARVDRTHTLKFGVDDSDLQSFDFDGGSPPELYTGDKKLYVEMSPEEDAQFYVVSDGPYPATLVGLILEGQTYD